MTTTAFVLGGGGVRGAVEVGMIRALLERGIRPDLIVGTSIGAINGAMLADDPSLGVIDRLTDAWASPNAAAVYGDGVLAQAGRAVRTRTHLNSPEPLRQMLADAIGADRRFNDLAVPLRVVAASIERAAEQVFGSGPVVPAVLASAAVPGFFPPVEIDGEHYIDGGVVNSIPIAPAIAAGATRVYVLQVGRVEEPLVAPTTPMQTARVAFEIARRHRFAQDIATLPDGVELHVLPSGGALAGDDTLRSYKRMDTVRRRMDQACVRTRVPRNEGRGEDAEAHARRGTGADPGRPRVRVPPTWVRRVLLAPLVIALAVLLLVSSPLWLLLALALTSLMPGRFRLPRVVWLVVVYLVWESALLIAAFALWVASGFGWKLRTSAFVDAHYRLGRGMLAALFWVFRAVLRLDIVAEGDGEAFADLLGPGAPLVVASRHGGPGDSFILVHTLLSRADRHPRIVLKDTLQWDPGIDVLLHRIPSRFITPSGFGTRRAGGGRSVEEDIADLSHEVRGRDAVVIFPEGGQVSAGRRTARIARLRAAGRHRLAARADRLQHVMPPQPGGVFAALGAAPEADAVLIGHTGLDRLHSLRDIWRELPMDKRLTMHAWRVPRGEIPPQREAQAEWLFGWFERIDGWITTESDRRSV